MNILAVDDDRAMRTLLSAELNSAGHYVLAAADGREALKEFESNSWDAVVTDRAMPGMGGEELAAEIKARRPETLVVMITGFAPENCCTHVDVLLQKPFSCDELLHALERRS